MVERPIDVGDMADVARLLCETFRQLSFLADEAELDELDPLAMAIQAAWGVVIELENRVAPTYVRARDELRFDLAEDVEDPHLLYTLEGLRWLISLFPEGPRPANEAAARAFRKARLEHIDHVLIGYEPRARSDAARQGEEHFLYLVRDGEWKKFGRGTARRVESYGAAEVVTVLCAEFSKVKQAEDRLRCLYAHEARPRPALGLPKNFGKGTEVVPASVEVDLKAALPEGTDVTVLFAELRSTRIAAQLGAGE